MATIVRKMCTNALRRVEKLPVLLFVGEANAHTFDIEPEAGVDFAAYEIKAVFVRPDQRCVNMTGSVDNIGASVTLAPECYAVAGGFRLTVFAESAAETVCIYACDGYVCETQGKGGTAGDAAPILAVADAAELRAMIAAIQNTINDLETSVDALQDRILAVEETIYN